MAFSKSTDPHLTLRRIERQHAVIECLRARSPEFTTARALADTVHVTPRTVERDIARMREAGIPIEVRNGPGGGYAIDARRHVDPITLTPGEAAALIVSLVALGPTATDAAGSAMTKLVDSLIHTTPPPRQLSRHA
ncbi:HTH domain-containing protein [Rhodococcus sp. OK611]|uniref:helix-turn-helix transcriptional regulator n=1 Tax=unclassified Rhodococcus (in: high G+C Gram-positive bacteria) TaxID=192944 RepID=UPI000BC4E3E9|nr:MULTISPECIES: HTH domain-containing protein [unclassified Rhodococcus (in: high G+C Gram-positive bacteria)]PTR37503.1 HTH domain-containing protein [Rhodococcus sp. OK611]SNX93409.1 HTH domain-containing protein [Rhodococcus sp. OK270]